MFNMNMFFFVMAFCSVVTAVHGQSYANMTTLKSTVMTSYDSDVIPVSNQSEILTVNLTLKLLNILEIDQVRGAVKYDIELKCEWYDEVIQWNPVAYSGITELYLSSKDVWTPPVVIGNPVQFAKLEQSWMNVLYTSDGLAAISPVSTVGTSCSFYMKFWPFDKQRCFMSFFIFGSKNTKLRLSVSEEAINTKYYVKNSEWTLMEDSITYEIDNSCGITEVRFYFHLMRQASFYMLTVVLPINGMVALTSLVFLLPSESGERVSYSITIMLSLAVFLTVTADALPKTADPAPMLCTYILCSMVLSILCLLLVILNLEIYYRDASTPISAWHKFMVRLARWRCRLNKPDDVQQIQNFHVDERSPSPVKKPNDMWTSGKDLPERVDDGNDELDNLTWKEVSQAIDKILFYTLVVVTYIPSIAVIAYIATASDYYTE